MVPRNDDDFAVGFAADDADSRATAADRFLSPVSYTHLTLPTIVGV